MRNTFRLDPIHKNSPAMAKIIKNVQRDGYFCWKNDRLDNDISTSNETSGT